MVLNYWAKNNDFLKSHFFLHHLPIFLRWFTRYWVSPKAVVLDTCNITMSCCTHLYYETRNLKIWTGENCSNEKPSGICFKTSVILTHCPASMSLTMDDVSFDMNDTFYDHTPLDFVPSREYGLLILIYLLVAGSLFLYLFL